MAKTVFPLRTTRTRSAGKPSKKPHNCKLSKYKPSSRGSCSHCCTGFTALRVQDLLLCLLFQHKNLWTCNIMIFSFQVYEERRNFSSGNGPTVILCLRPSKAKRNIIHASKTVGDSRLALAAARPSLSMCSPAAPKMTLLYVEPYPTIPLTWPLLSLNPLLKLFSCST